jgi:DNA-binding NarL/FixJ family response regulator
MDTKQRITVLLADDHKVIRKELRKMLEAESDLQVVGEAANGKQAVEMAGKLCPAVVVSAIREVQKGNTFLSPAIAKSFHKRKAHPLR